MHWSILQSYTPADSDICGGDIGTSIPAIVSMCFFSESPWKLRPKYALCAPSCHFADGMNPTTWIYRAGILLSMRLIMTAGTISMYNYGGSWLPLNPIYMHYVHKFYISADGFYPSTWGCGTSIPLWLPRMNIALIFAIHIISLFLAEVDINGFHHIHMMHRGIKISRIVCTNLDWVAAHTSRHGCFWQRLSPMESATCE